MHRGRGAAGVGRGPVTALVARSGPVRLARAALRAGRGRCFRQNALECTGLMDHAPTQAHLTVVQHGRLARCHRPLRRVKGQAQVIGADGGDLTRGVGLAVTFFIVTPLI